MIYILKKPSAASSALADMVTGTFTAEKINLNLSERQSTMTVTVGPQAPTVSVGSWLRDDTDPGKGIVWRVKTVDTDYATDTRTITCEHLIRTLKDSVMFGEVTPGDISGNKKGKKCTAKQAAQYILKNAKEWTLGSFAFTKSAEYSFNGDDLLSALETVSGSLEDAWWSYDFSSYPFKVSITKKNSDVSCEMRLSRNIRTLKKQIDMSRMYTRFYPIGKNNLKLKSGYVEKNTALYGVVSKVETDNEMDSEAKLTDWANERLATHAEPSVTVTISGMELSQATGEALDKLTLGRICRVPLPEFSTIITERITKLSYSDKVNDPESVQVTLANSQEDVASIINKIQKSSGRSGRSGAKKDEEDHAWFEDTTDHVAMVAEAVGGEGASKDWSRVSKILVDGKGIHQRVTKAEGDIVTQEARLDITEEAITAEVEDRKSGESSIIQQTAKDITAAVDSSKDELRAELKIERERIGLVVQGTGDNAKIKPAEIVASINNGSSNIRLSADHIDIEGLVTSLEAWDVMVANFNANNGEFTGDVSVLGDITAAGDIQANGHDLKISDITVSSNVMTVYKTDGTDFSVTFREAATLEAEYGGDNTGDTATYTVKAKQNGQVIQTTTGTFKVKQSKSSAYVIDAGGTIRGLISNPQYGNGWAAAYAKVSLPTTSSTASSFSVQTPPSTVDGTAATETYTLSSAMNNVVVVKNSGGTVVSRLEHGKYDAGWAAAYAKVTLPTTSNTEPSFQVKTPPSTVGGAAATETYTLSSPMNNVEVVKNSSGTIVARHEHGKYDAGWTAAYNKVSFPVSQDLSKSYISFQYPPTTVNGSAVSVRYYLTIDKNYTYLRYGSPSPTSSTIVARVTNGFYRQGWAAAYSKVSLPSSSSTASSFQVKTPPVTVDGAAVTETYTASASSNNVVVVKNSGGTVVSRLEHGKYDAGWAAAYAKVDLPSSSSTASSFQVKTPPSTVGGSAVTETYTASASSNNVVVVKNSGGTVVARLEHGKYDAGWGAARERLSIPTTLDTSSTYINVQYPPATVNGSASSAKYYLGADSDYVYLRYGSASPNAGTVVAQISNVAPTVSNWTRTPFPQNTSHGPKHAFDIPISVDVNGVTKSHTFTTPDMYLRYVKVGTVDTYELVCGSTPIYRFEV